MELVRRRSSSAAVVPIAAAVGILLAALTAALSPAVVARSAMLLEKAEAAAPRSSAAGPSRTAPTQGLSVLKHEGRRIPHYLARPASELPWPAVVLVHGAWGLDGEVRKVADRLAESGFLVMAPDLHGKVALDADKARELAAILDDQEAAATVAALAAHLKPHPHVGDHRVGAVGLGMGGRLALLAAMGSTDLSAVASASGAPITDLDTLRRVPCPILALYGGSGGTVPAAQVDAFRSALQQARRTAEVVAVEGAGDDLLGAAGPSRPAAGSSEDPWDRLTSFLKSHL